MAASEAQINVRLPAELDSWIEKQAGGKRKKAAFVRRLLERERARAAEAEVQSMFDAAWDGLSAEERRVVQAEREQWLSLYAEPEDG